MAVARSAGLPRNDVTKAINAVTTPGALLSAIAIRSSESVAEKKNPPEGKRFVDKKIKEVANANRDLLRGNHPLVRRPACRGLARGPKVLFM